MWISLLALSSTAWPLPVTDSLAATWHPGYCASTNLHEGSCGTTGEGQFPTESAEHCLQKCSECAGCVYVSYGDDNDCSWFRECNLERLHPSHCTVHFSARLRDSVGGTIQPQLLQQLASSYSRLITVRSREQTFSSIYDGACWGSEGGGSGTGSKLKATRGAIRAVTTVVREYQIGSIVDAPCGAMLWQQGMIESLTHRNPRLRYLGLDVVPSVLKRNTKKFADSRLVSFQRIDLAGDGASIPSGRVAPSMLTPLRYLNARTMTPYSPVCQVRPHFFSRRSAAQHAQG